MKKILIIISTLLLMSCSHMGYYWQAMGGQLEIISKRQSMDDVLAAPDTSSELKQKLQYIQRVRDFASRELQLPDNDSYRSYVDVNRPYLVWNVFAAPEFSLEPYQSCFLVVGCVSYRGYFNRQDAQAFASELEQQGYDVFVAGISAYSTLGWFDDPVPNTIIQNDNTQIAGLIFHELAHQKIYVKNDTAFNESFAMTVELAGVKQWLQGNGDPELYQQYLQDKQRRQEFIALLMNARQKLAALYASDNANKNEAKQIIFAELRRDYESLKQGWNGDVRYDSFMSQQFNNAYFISVGLYFRYVDAFSKILEQQGNDWGRFYQKVSELQELSAKEREEYLKSL